MAKQKTFWAALKGRKVDHLWRRSKWWTSSACGLTARGRIYTGSTGTRCKNCERALKQ